ncbi:MAG: aldehyde ferredoxin oxidoreductase [Anaerolineaceae bacterium]|nr:aldehyde ferredoxin oxidoreductase [Anaerolineaceae bacterium]
MKTLTVNLATGTLQEKPLADPLLGGRLLTGMLVSELVPPKTDPLGPENILAFAAGPLSGRNVSTGGRLSVGGKSPLTQGIKEANAGGMGGDSIAALGYRAIVFTGMRPAGDLSIFILDEEGGRLADGRAYANMWNSQLVKALKKDFGDGYVFICNGYAGEHQYKAAGVAVSDVEDQPFRLAARGGLGAVMGSKGLKAVLVRKITSKTILATSKDARTKIVDFNKFVAGSERVVTLRKFGTASTVMPVQTMGGLPVRNFSIGQIENAEGLSAETMYNLILERGGAGSPTHACMRGCVIQCSNIFPKEDGTLAVSPVEFETLGLCGSNLDITNIDEIARLNCLCNELGLDTIEVGAALGVMMEAAETGCAPEPYKSMNLPYFGDSKRAAEVLEEIATGGELGKLIANGVVHTGKTLGVKRIPAVKGQAMSAYDPRVVKGTGVTYATSPMGADHTAGLTVFLPINHMDASKAVSASRAMQIQRAAYDALGLCSFNTGAVGQRPDFAVNMIRTTYDIDLPDDWLNELGLRTIRMEIAFNRAAGFTAEDDRLPDYFVNDQVAPNNTTFDVPAAELDAMWN